MAAKLPFHFPVILGWDVAGVVEEVGPAVTWFRPGDQVYGYIRRHHLQYGTYAEYATAPEGFFAHMPPELSFEEAAALPLAVLTAHQALEAVGLRGGETLFLSGGAGGVGHVAIQLATARGARVIATAFERNHDFLRELGAEPLDYATADCPPACAPCWPTRAPTPRSTSSAATRASRRSRPFAPAAARVDRPAAARAARGTTRSATLRAPERLRPRRAHHAAGRRGQPAPARGGAFPLERAADAHERLEEGHVRGKLVLTVDAARSRTSSASTRRSSLAAAASAAHSSGALAQSRTSGSTRIGTPVTRASAIASLGRASTSAPSASTISA